jgi:hypothetical protein
MLRHDELVAKGIDVNAPLSSATSSRDSSPSTTATSSPVISSDHLSSSLAAAFPATTLAPPTDDDFLDIPPSRQRSMTDMGPMITPLGPAIVSSGLPPIVAATTATSSSGGIGAALAAARANNNLAGGPVFHARGARVGPPPVVTASTTGRLTHSPAFSSSLPVSPSMLTNVGSAHNNNNNNNDADPFEPLSPGIESSPPSPATVVTATTTTSSNGMARKNRGGKPRRGAVASSLEHDSPFPDQASDDDSMYSESDDDHNSTNDNNNNNDDNDDDITPTPTPPPSIAPSASPIADVPAPSIDPIATVTPPTMVASTPIPTDTTHVPAPSLAPVSSTVGNTGTTTVSEVTTSIPSTTPPPSTANTTTTTVAPVTSTSVKVAPPLPRTGPTLHLRPSRATLSGAQPTSTSRITAPPVSSSSSNPPATATGAAPTSVNEPTPSSSLINTNDTTNTTTTTNNNSPTNMNSITSSDSTTDQMNDITHESRSDSIPGHHKSSSLLSQLLRSPDMEFTSHRQRSPAVYQSDRPPNNAFPVSPTADGSTTIATTTNAPTPVVGSLPTGSRLSGEKTSPTEKKVTFNEPSSSGSPPVVESSDVPAKKHNRKRSSTEPFRNANGNRTPTDTATATSSGTQNNMGGGTTLYRTMIPPGGGPPVRVVNRGYTMKKEPSWCDRILWRSIFDRHCRQSSYYRCEGLYTSDHLPVASSFDLSVPLPPPVWVYGTSATIILSDLYVDFTPSNPVYQLFQLPYHSLYMTLFVPSSNSAIILVWSVKSIQVVKYM